MTTFLFIYIGTYSPPFPTSRLQAGNNSDLVSTSRIPNILSTTAIIPFSLSVHQPFFGRPLPFPDRDRLSRYFPFGLVGTVTPLFRASPLSLTESPLPESLEEFFRSLLFALALILASLIDVAGIQLPLISVFISSVPPFSSSPENGGSLRFSSSQRQRRHKKVLLTEAVIIKMTQIVTFQVFHSSISKLIEVLSTEVKIFNSHVLSVKLIGERGKRKEKMEGSPIIAKLT